MTTHHVLRLSSTELVERYLAFFRSRQHVELPGSPLAVSGNSTSFVIAGMQPLLPYLRGQQTPPSTRLVALQRCLRSDDIDVVGTNDYKGSFFHMLGNWSVGDYGKREAIEMALELLSGAFGLESSQLWVTIFAGEPELCLLPDELARESWLRLGIPPEHIVPLGTDDNLWTMGGPGPCGPCTEIYVDRGPVYGCARWSVVQVVRVIVFWRSGTLFLWSTNASPMPCCIRCRSAISIRAWGWNVWQRRCKGWSPSSPSTSSSLRVNTCKGWRHPAARTAA